MMRKQNVLALDKDDERYFFFFDQDDESIDAMMQTLGRQASDKELSFTWYDAAVLSQKVRRMQKKTHEETGEVIFESWEDFVAYNQGLPMSSESTENLAAHQEEMSKKWGWVNGRRRF